MSNKEHAQALIGLCDVYVQCLTVMAASGVLSGLPDVIYAAVDVRTMLAFLSAKYPECDTANHADSAAIDNDVHAICAADGPTGQRTQAIGVAIERARALARRVEADLSAPAATDDCEWCTQCGCAAWVCDAEAGWLCPSHANVVRGV